MTHSHTTSHDSLSPEECDRLVLSPPPVAFNPEELREFLSVTRTVSAKHSLHSVNLSGGTPPLPRHASIAWSRSEFDSKFKHYESQVKAAEAAEALRYPSAKQVSLASDRSIDADEKDVPISQPHSVVSTQPMGERTSPPKQDLLVASSPRRPSSWKRLFCCVSAHPQMDTADKPILSPAQPCGEPVDVSVDHSQINTTKIKSQRKWGSLFRKKSREGRSPVTLTSVTKQSLFPSADERLKSPAPTVVVTRHHDPNGEIDYGHGEENGVAGLHYHNDDHMSESTNSRDSLPSDENYSDTDEQHPGEDLLGQIAPDCVGKKCLVLDLDETLVHSSFKPVDNADFSVIVEIENIQHEVSVCTRPHLDAFINAVGPLFEVVMFTASLSKYADPVCDRIDPTGQFRHRLFRESCVCFKSNYIKHLAVLGRDIDQICIIDNSPVSFYFHRQNALQIATWFDDPSDTALLDLIPYLKGLAGASSVIDYISTHAPPPHAAIAQPDTIPWLLGPQEMHAAGAAANGYYDDQEEDEEDVELDEEHQQQGSTSSRPPPHDIITMAQRPAAPPPGPPPTAAMAAST